MAISKEDIRKNIQGSIDRYNTKIALWEAVKRVTKKDGSDFQAFGKNFTNCEITREYDDINLNVCGRTPAGEWVSDYIRTRTCVDYWHGEKPAEDRIKRAWGLKDYFYLNPAETMEAIEATITSYKKWRDENLKALEKLDPAYEYTEKVMAELREKLKELCGSDRSTLYHRLEEKIQKFPYC